MGFGSHGAFPLHRVCGVYETRKAVISKTRLSGTLLSILYEPQNVILELHSYMKLNQRDHFISADLRC